MGIDTQKILSQPISQSAKDWLQAHADHVAQDLPDGFVDWFKAEGRTWADVPNKIGTLEGESGENALRAVNYLAANVAGYDVFTALFARYAELAEDAGLVEAGSAKLFANRVQQFGGAGVKQI